MSRIRLTLAVAITLTASYQLYAQWADSFTRVVSKPVEPPSRPVAPLPETFVEVAQQFLPDVGWLKSPGYTFQRDNELFVYAGAAEPVHDAASGTSDPHAADRIRLSPFVLIWIDPERPERPPYVVQCDTARVQFENPVEFSFDAPSPGRLKAAWFDGTVKITGPDGLNFEGENFDFSEDSLSLYSPLAVRFSYGPSATSEAQVQGAAEGVLVNFTQNADPELGPDMPRIGGIERVRLLKSVVLDCIYEERDGKQTELASAHISCDETLDYHAGKHEAILLKNVLVRRPTGGAERPHEADALRCHQLALRFVERVNQEAAGGEGTPAQPAAKAVSGRISNPFSGLRVKEAEARGTPRGERAVLESDEHGVTARMQLMQFDVDTGTAILSDSEAVRVDRDGTQLHSPQIRISPQPETRKPILVCLGTGRLQHADPKTGDPILEATWANQLRAAPDPETGLRLVQLAGDVRLIVSEDAQARSGLKAEQLNLWVDDTPEEGAVQGEPAPTLIPGNGLTDLGANALPLRFVEARGDVMVGVTREGRSTLIAETQLLQAEVRSGTLLHPDEDKAQAAGGEQPAQPAPADEPWHLASREIRLTLLNESGTRNVQIAEAVADGEVLLTQSPASDATVEAGAKPEQVSLSGTHLQLVNEGGTHQFVILTGAPALLSRGKFLLECRNLQLDRAGNEVAVVGEGLLQAPVDRDLNGAELTQPVLLDVKWQSGMTFDGTRAEFRQRVSLQLRDSVLQCDEMDVRLDQRLSFADPRPRAEEVPIRDVDCRNGVHVEIYDWDENRIVGIRKAQLTRFMLDYQSGAFQGDGPGKVNHWSFSEGRRSVAIAPRKPAQANVPVSSNGLDWEHVSIEFDDLLLGNFKDRTAELHGRVRTIYAPVRRVSETFVRNDLSGSSPSVEHAVFLGCDSMTLEMQPASVADGSVDRLADLRMSVRADGRCQLEGHLFHAWADSLTYEESKQLFTLRGKGDRQASVTYQAAPGAEPHRGGGRIIQFDPVTGNVRVENSSGLQGTQ